jgi:hypothetical protein
LCGRVLADIVLVRRARFRTGPGNRSIHQWHGHPKGPPNRRRPLRPRRRRRRR